MSDHTSSQIKSTEQQSHDGLAQVSQTLSKLRFGSVLLTVHDGALVQIDVTEKRRFTLR